MKLSPKKIRRIQKRARGRPADEVARELGLPVEVVEEALAKGGARVATPGDVADGIERALPWAVAILAGVAPFAVIPRGQFNPALLPQSVFVVTGSLAVLMAGLFAGALRGRLTVRRAPLVLPGLCFLGWAFVSLAWAHNGRAGLERLLLWSACAAAYVVALGSLRSPRDGKRLMIALAVSGAVAAVVGLLQYYCGVRWFPQVVSPASTFGNKNFAAQYMVLTLPAAAALFLAERRPKAYWPLAGALVLTGAMTFHAFSKAGWLGAAMGMGLFGALALRGAFGGARTPWSRGKTAASLAAAALLVLSLNTGPNGFEFRIGRAFGALGNVAADAARGTPVLDDGAADDVTSLEAAGPGGAPSLGIRLDLWRNTLAMVRDHPVAGVGIGNFRIEFPPYSNRVVQVEWFGAKLQPKHAHNDFLQILAELGIVGFGLMVWVLVAVVRTAVAALRIGARGETHYMIFAAVAGTSGLLVTAVFSFPFGTSVAPFTFMVLLGFLGAAGSAAAGNRNEGVDAARRFDLPPRAAWVATAAVFVMLLFTAWRGYHGIVADRHFSRARMSSACDVVIAEAAAALRHDPGVNGVRLFAARAYLARGEPRKAVAHLRKLLEVEPHSMAAMSNLIQAYSKTGEHEKAVECARRVLEMKPGSATALNNLGYCYLDFKRPREAEESFRAALLSDPGFAPAHFGLGRLALEAGRKDDALEEFRAAARLDLKKARFREMAVRLACEVGRIDEARAAAMAKPRHASALYQFGRILADAGDPAGALEPLRRAAALAPTNFEYHHRLGYAAFKAKRYPEAQGAFAQAVRLRPDWALARRSLGTVLYTFLGERDEGVRHYREALTLDPGAADAAKMREIVRRWDASRRQ